MFIYPKGSFTGNYQPRGNVEEADCIIGSEFGYRYEEPGLSNDALAGFIAELQPRLGVDIFVPTKIAQGLAKIPGAPRPTAVYEGGRGGRTNYFGTKGIATAGELALATSLMDEYDLSRPILIAQPHHIGRVAAQFMLEGVAPIVPPGLPDVFDKYSMQSWTRGPIRWARREAMVVPYMRYKKQI